LALKFLWAHHGDNQITAKHDGNDSEDEIFHKIFWSELLATDDIEQKSQESSANRPDVDCVHHNFVNHGINELAAIHFRVG
jgi:hypothetical protein